MSFPRWISGLLVLSLLLTACSSKETLNLSNLKSGSVLFQDDFSDPASGWLQGNDDQGLTEYADGGMRIYVAKDVASELTLLEKMTFADARIEVDASKTGGPDDNDFGVVCRYQDENNFYFLEISSDGYYGIGKYKDNKLTLVSSEQMQSSDAIHQGTAANHLRVDCVGTTLTLYANGVQLASVEDYDFHAGSVGLIGGTFQTAGADILFDNFSVLVP